MAWRYWTGHLSRRFNGISASFVRESAGLPEANHRQFAKDLWDVICFQNEWKYVSVGTWKCRLAREALGVVKAGSVAIYTVGGGSH
jgi:hypothetical protein